MSTIPTSLAPFFESLEKLTSINPLKIQRELNACGEIPLEWEDRIRTERKSLFCSINQGELIEHFSTTNTQGETSRGLIFKKEEIEYLKLRIRVTENVWLKSRYSNLLWRELKHLDYAKSAIENYVLCIKNIGDNEIRDLQSLLDACLYISKKTSLYKEELKQIIFDFFETVPDYFKPNLVESILKNQIISNEDLERIAKDSINWIDKETHYHLNERCLEIAIALRTKIGMSCNVCYELLAENEEIIIRQHPNDSDFVKFISVGNQVKYLKKSKNLKKLKEAQLEFQRLKLLIELPKVTTELNGEELVILNDYINNFKDKLLLKTSEQILAFLSISESVIVDYQSIRKRESESIKNSIWEVFTTSVLDNNTNYKTLNDKGKLQGKIVQSYTMEHSVKFYMVFTKLFAHGILRGKLNYYKVYSFFEEFTWYGQKLKKKITDNELDKESTWLSMLAPGLHNLFGQFEFSILNQSNEVYNYILAIDSLTLKFEGALRDFIRLTGGCTTRERNGEFQEVLLDELLENEMVKEYFSLNDIELFKYTFTRQGVNLRNNVAHCFMEYSQYNLQNASLVFLCLLRLGKYRVGDG